MAIVIIAPADITAPRRAIHPAFLYGADQLLQYVNTFVESTMQINGSILRRSPLSLPSPTLFAINGNPVVLVFFFVRRRVIDINAIWLYGRPAERPVVGQSWWKDNDMQIDHVQTYVIAIDTCMV